MVAKANALSSLVILILSILVMVANNLKRVTRSREKYVHKLQHALFLYFEGVLRFGGTILNPADRVILS